MVKKEHRKAPRVRATNKSLEAKQFSTVRLPRKAEVRAANEGTLPDDMRAHGAFGAAPKKPATTAPAATSADFDPIPNDGTFVIVENSKHWPPPKLDEVLLQRAGGRLVDGLDTYDRSDDAGARVSSATLAKGGHAAALRPAAAPRRAETLKLAAVAPGAPTARQRKPGEVALPKGKTATNQKMTFGDDDE